MMEEPKQPNKESELVSVEGLQFERYQMDWIEISAKLDGQMVYRVSCKLNKMGDNLSGSLKINNRS